MALGSFNLFVGQAEQTILSLRVKALQTMFDMMMLYPNDLLYAKNGEQVKLTSRQESPYKGADQLSDSRRSDY